MTREGTPNGNPRAPARLGKVCNLPIGRVSMGDTHRSKHEPIPMHRGAPDPATRGPRPATLIDPDHRDGRGRG